MTEYEIISVVISSLSFFIAIIALLFSKKDKPNLMPFNHYYTPFANVTHFTLVWKNSSEKVIHDLTLILNIFDVNLNEVLLSKVENKFYFSISNDSEFYFSFQPLQTPFFARVRFKGKYLSILPFIRFSFSQEIWYSFYPLIDKNNNNQITGYNVYNTYDKNIEDLKLRNKQILKIYDKEIDKKKW